MGRLGNVLMDGVRNVGMGCTLHREGVPPKSLSVGSLVVQDFGRTTQDSPICMK